ncbi:MAG TPA: hypothetical protein VM537_25455, partial [Anaerolineae bacterium]|nr:hypothetical protein [Anaerolineae bacterium]
MRPKTRLLEAKELLHKLLPHLQVVRGPDARGEYVCWCPFHADGKGKPPHRPNLQVSERGFICRACDAKGSLKRLAKHVGMQGPTSDVSLEAAYDYCDEEGNLLYQVCRYPYKQFWVRRPDEAGGWIWNLKGVRRVLYRLPDLLASPDAPVYVTEGEKDADRLAREGVVATTNFGGAGKWSKAYAEPLREHDVVIIPDNDEPGRQHADRVARLLHGVARSVKVIELPDLPKKGDVRDWLDDAHSVQELQAIVDATPAWSPPLGGVETPTSEEGGKRESQATLLIDLVLTQCVHLFHDERREPYATVPLAGRRQIMAVGSRHFRDWLSSLAWKDMGKALGGDVLAAACQVLAGKARFESPQCPLQVRCAWYGDAIWIDLDGSRAVQVRPDGWEIVLEPPILFRSFPHQRALPEPVKGGNPREVLQFLNLRDHDAEVLLLCYLVAALVPDIPVAALVVHGPQGSAKTTLLKVLKRLLDPSAVEVRGSIRDPGEFAQAAFQTRVLFFDNLSRMPQWFSDALCRTVSGEGWSKRTLYTDEDTTVLEYQRVVG